MIGRTGIPNWDIYDLDSKPHESLLEIQKDSEGYYLDVNGDKISFNGNRELRPAYNFLTLNEYHIQEIIKCRNDLRYFMYNYVKILTPKGYATPELREYQARLMYSLLTSNRVLALFGRQSGKTTVTSIKYLWDINFYSNVPVGIAANISKGAAEIVDKIKKMFNSLPIWMQQGVTKWNVQSISFENGSKIITSATNGDAFRGFSLVGGNGHGGLYLDECVEYNEIITVRDKETGEIKEIPIGVFFDNLPIKYKEHIKLTEKYEILTPSGFQSFSGVKKSTRTDGIKLIFSDNTELICTPEHLLKCSNNSFIKAITSLGKNIITNTGNVQVTKIQDVYTELEFFDALQVNNGHEYFTSNKVSHNCAFVSRKTFEEFADSVLPTVSSDAKSNIVMTSTPNGYNHWYDLVDGARKDKNGYNLVEMDWWEVPGRDEAWRQKQIEENGLIFFNQNYGCEFIGSSATLISPEGLTKLKDMAKEPIESTGDFRVYSKPKKGSKYIILIDLASGNGYGDYTAAQVIEINKRGFTQAAVFHSNNVPIIRMTNVLYEIGKQYNDAYMLFEINYGEEIASRMYRDIEYENLLTIAVRDGKQNLLGFKGTFQVGFKTTKKTKQQMLSALRTLIESGKLKIHDKLTIDEFFMFIAKGESYEAEEGSHDDLVMSTALLGWLVNQDQFKELIQYDFIEDYTSSVADELIELLPSTLFGDSEQIHQDLQYAW